VSAGVARAELTKLAGPAPKMRQAGPSAPPANKAYGAGRFAPADEDAEFRAYLAGLARAGNRAAAAEFDRLSAAVEEVTAAEDAAFRSYLIGKAHAGDRAAAGALAGLDADAYDLITRGGAL
jgi:hypothetical protein